MQIQERLIVPGLGIVILLAAFILGVPLVYKLLLGLLGLAASATYFAPPAVQVETRIAIAALGLIILLIVSSTAFWLTLLSFGAIAALQIQHRHTLQRSLATVAWLNELLERRSSARAGEAAGGGGQEAGGAAVAAAGGGESVQAPAPLEAGALPAFVRLNVGGIGTSIFGVIVLLSLFMPWVIFLVDYGNDETESMSFSLLAAADTLESSVPHVFFGILLVLCLLSVASIVLPPLVSAIVSILGFVVTTFTWFYFLVGSEAFAKAILGDYIPRGVAAGTFPYLGVGLASLSFVVIFVLQVIPALNRTRG